MNPIRHWVVPSLKGLGILGKRDPALKRWATLKYKPTKNGQLPAKP